MPWELSLSLSSLPQPRAKRAGKMTPGRQTKCVPRPQFPSGSMQGRGCDPRPFKTTPEFCCPERETHKKLKVKMKVTLYLGFETCFGSCANVSFSVPCSRPSLDRTDTQTYRETHREGGRDSDSRTFFMHTGRRRNRVQASLRFIGEETVPVNILLQRLLPGSRLQ